MAHGTIERSNRFPNCSYFRHWTSTGDKITWNAEVGADGTYEVVLYFAAKEAGAKCELRFNDAVLEFDLSELEFNPPVEAATFMFDAPEGTEIVDLRN